MKHGFTALGATREVWGSMGKYGEYNNLSYSDHVCLMKKEPVKFTQLTATCIRLEPSTRSASARFNAEIIDGRGFGKTQFHFSPGASKEASYV